MRSQALVTNVMWGYQAFATHGPEAVADPGQVYGDVASTVSLIRNGTTVALAILSDLIMVSMLIRPRNTLGDELKCHCL